MPFLPRITLLSAFLALVVLNGGCRSSSAPGSAATIRSDSRNVSLNPEQAADRGEESPSGTTAATAKVVPIVRVSQQEEGTPAAASEAAPPTLRDLPPAHLKAVPAAIPGSPGIIVCSPVVKNGDAALGAGCGLWLYVAVGGHPELGQTPLITSAARAARELGKQDFRLEREEGLKLARMTGATHVAVGEISGAAASGLTLVYSVWDARKSAPLGAPVRVTGTPEQIVAKLPGMASQIARRLGIAKPRIGTRVGESAADIRLMGRLAWGGDASEADLEQLYRLGQRSVAAALQYVDSSGGSNQRRVATVKKLLQQAPDNPLAWGQVGYTTARDLAPYRAQLASNIRRFPRSYAFAHTSTWVQRVLARPKEERLSAEAAVRNAPRNPDAWLSLGWTFGEAGHRLRAGRFAQQLTGAEWEYLNAVYPQWLRVVRRAAELDPLHGTAWLRVATAATFAGEPEIADAAFWKAVKLYPNTSDVFGWGLQMYQPKWGGDPEKLAKVARMAADARYPSITQTMWIAESLKTAKFETEAQQVFERVARESREAIRKNPDDSQAHYNLAQVHQRQENLDAMIQELEAVVRLRPDDPAAHYDLGYALKHRGGSWLPMAQRELEQAVRLLPDYAAAYNALGHVHVLRQRHDDAIRAYQTALRLAPFSPDAHKFLCLAYSQKQQWDKAIKHGKEAVRQSGNDYNARIYLAYAYAKNDQPAGCAAHSRKALRIYPDSGMAHEYLGEALMDMGKKEEGRKYLERALTLGDARAAAEAQRVLDYYAKQK